ncbi:MAG: tetratricopeptide repeat protein, partial [Mucilaginibacter sp.]
MRKFFFGLFKVILGIMVILGFIFRVERRSRAIHLASSIGSADNTQFNEAMKRMRGDVDTTVMPDYNWMIGADTASPDGYIIRARVKRDQYKNYDGCIDDLNIAVSCFADTDYLHRGDYTSLVGDVWRQAGQPTKAVISYKAAIKYYNKMLKRHPDQIFAIYGKAVDQQKLKLYKPAVINLETALKYAPKNAIIYERLAQLQDIVGDHDKAVANADSAVKLNRD